MSPLDSLIPAMLGWAASTSARPAGQVMPVKAGTE